MAYKFIIAHLEHSKLKKIYKSYYIGKIWTQVLGYLAIAFFVISIILYGTVANNIWPGFVFMQLTLVLGTSSLSLLLSLLRPYGKIILPYIYKHTKNKKYLKELKLILGFNTNAVAAAMFESNEQIARILEIDNSEQIKKDEENIESIETE
ncbi:hypothetical protein [Metamycoplasma neophronis]|uniref:Uncharacterized protein n=1 Tax=Metamycoplasma neophronis TaxID=872983 RepID=A0ABY2Z0N2_9BACT|nr:hypothetical protein [Metamycoplasma neophronis]TPR54707.1 hypothetical protein FJR74_00340 [Metamycoplasma neophronis]